MSLLTPMLLANVLRNNRGLRVVGNAETGFRMGLTEVAGRNRFRKVKLGLILGIPIMLAEARPLLWGRNIIVLLKTMALLGWAIPTLGVHLRLARNIPMLGRISGEPIRNLRLAIGPFGCLSIRVCVLNRCGDLVRRFDLRNAVEKLRKIIENGVTRLGPISWFPWNELNRAKELAKFPFLIMTISVDYLNSLLMLMVSSRKTK